MPRYFTYQPGVKGSKLKLRPNQHLAFREGEGYYAAPGKAVPKAKPKATSALDVNQIINSYFQNAFLTPAQQRKAARDQVSEAIAEQTRAFNQERERQRQSNLSQQMTAEGLAIAMQAMKNADADAARAAWQTAGGNMTSFAQALAGSVQGAQQAALNEAQGTVQGGSQIIAPSPEANAAVSTAVGGTLPAATAMANAQAQYQAARERGDAQGARFWDQQRALAFEQQQTETAYAGQFADIQRQRPKLLREATEAQQARQREELATLMSVLNVKSSLDQARDKSTLDWAKLDETTRSNKADEAAARVRNRLTKQRNEAWETNAVERARIANENALTARSKAQGIDPVTGKPYPGFKFDAKGNVIKDPAQAKKADQSLKLESDLRKQAAKWFESNFVNKDLKRPRRRPPTKADLVRRMMGAFGNTLVGRNGITKEAVQMWLSQVLNSYDNRWFTDAFYGTGKPKGGTSSGDGTSLLG